MSLFGLFKRRARDRFEWHLPWHVPPSARDIEGRKVKGSATVYRRRKTDDTGWEYRQEPESDEDWATRVGW